jgi:hypothetical protein
MLVDIHYNEMIMEPDRTIGKRRVYSKSARKIVEKIIKKPASVEWKHFLFNSILNGNISLVDDQNLEVSGED